MAYSLKNVRYQSSDRKILLQNENGPCPLLAAANALLLRGAIQLPSVCIRNGCASLEEVVNMLAEKAMNYNTAGIASSNTTATDDTWTEVKNSNTNTDSAPPPQQPLNTTTTTNINNDHLHARSNSEQYVHEVLDVLPKLQYGMDVNPKFTNGPTGMEFTTELTTFDLLNVKMVHGWLLDPQSDQALVSLIGSKTYNELVESVIHGNEATAELHKMEEQLKKLEQCTDDEVIHIGVPADETEDGVDAKPKSTKQSVGELRAQFRDKQEDLSRKATVGSLINNFLDHTGHQLTQYGLSVLYEHLAENELCVFFRNNHFSTLTKSEGVLFLLVTDLGYANVPNVVWEKIDVIDGDTEYVDAGFSRPAPHSELTAQHQGSAGGGYNLDPDQLLAQRGQSEADYQLALQLSAGGAGGNATNAATSTTPAGGLDEQEGSLMAAATEASLRTYNGVDDGIAADSNSNNNKKQPPPQDMHTTQEDQDRLLAMQMQAELENNDMRLAQQMQETEWANQRQNNANSRAPHTPATAINAAAAKAQNCVIS